MSRYTLNHRDSELERVKVDTLPKFSETSNRSPKWNDYQIFEYTLQEALNTVLTSEYSKDGSIKNDDDNDWNGGTWQDMIDIIRGKSETNKEYRNVIWENSLKLKAETSEFKRKYLYDVTGQEFDIDLVLKNVPECWIKRENIRVKPAINVCVNIWMNCTIKISEMVNRGSVIVSLIEKLQKDYHVNLQVICTSAYHNKLWMHKINVNCYPLDIDEVAFLLANPLALRRLNFALLEHHTKRNSCRDESYGHSSEISDIPSDTIYFPSSGGDDMTKYRSLENTKRILEDYIKKWNKE